MANSRNIHKRKQNGYTLIELLLVVTVIALIAALGVKTYRDKAQSDRINLAALDIQHVLEAGMAYRVNGSGLWPTPNSTLPCAKASTTDTFTTDYLPNANNQSNYGTYFCWSGYNATTGKQDANLFWVAMPITDSDTTSAADTAKRIAARLPNAVITSNPNDSSSTVNQCNTSPCYVKAEVTVPSAASTTSGLYVAGAGNCDPDVPNAGDDSHPGGIQPGTSGSVTCKRTTLGQQFSSVGSGYTNRDSLNQYEINFQCRPGETPYLQASPNFLRVDRYSGAKIKDGTGWTVANIYQLSVVPEFEAYKKDGGGGTSDTKDDVITCDSDSGRVTCTVNIVANLGAQNTLPVTTIGCRDEYTNPAKAGALCICGYPWSNKDYTGCPDQPGAVGASYVAMCAPAATSPNLANDDKNNSYW